MVKQLIKKFIILINIAEDNIVSGGSKIIKILAKSKKIKFLKDKSLEQVNFLSFDTSNVFFRKNISYKNKVKPYDKEILVIVKAFKSR